MMVKEYGSGTSLDRVREVGNSRLLGIARRHEHEAQQQHDLGVVRDDGSQQHDEAEGGGLVGFVVFYEA